MIKEAYVSFEIAKLLKEKGFECEEIRYVYYYYDEDDDYCFEKLLDRDKFVLKKMIAVPTQQMAMRWLREVYNIDFSVEISDIIARPRKYYVVIWDKENKSYILALFNSYEEAVEEALKYCLTNLI